MELPNLLVFSLVVLCIHTIPRAEGRDLNLLPRHNVSMVTDDLPTSVDWRSRGVILPPLDQKRCECCWALATTAAIEGLYRIKTGRSLRLSAQLLVDCDKTNGGCSKGSPRKAFRWIAENGGIASHADYPFVAQQGTCNEAKKSTHAVTITGFAKPGKTEADLMMAVARQPVVAGLSLAQDDEFMKYNGGIFEGPCGEYKHAVTVVGYGANGEGVPFWIVKNSYGISWSDKGYMYVRRGVQQPGGMCGIALGTSYPLM